MGLDIHAEIMYDKENGESVHSDICPPSCKPDNLSDKNYREYLHTCLDEWLDKSRGSGIFWIGDSSYLKEY